MYLIARGGEGAAYLLCLGTYLGTSPAGAGQLDLLDCQSSVPRAEASMLNRMPSNVLKSALSTSHGPGAWPIYSKLQLV